MGLAHKFVNLRLKTGSFFVCLFNSVKSLSVTLTGPRGLERQGWLRYMAPPTPLAQRRLSVSRNLPSCLGPHGASHSPAPLKDGKVNTLGYFPKVMSPDSHQSRSYFCLLLLPLTIVCPDSHHLHQLGYFKTRQIPYIHVLLFFSYSLCIPLVNH